MTTLQILTVGDGDLSLSLALARAYGTTACCPTDDASIIATQRVQVTASTLLASQDDLIRTYPLTAPTNLQHLQQAGCKILYNVDATQLHVHYCVSSSTVAAASWDMIVFYHPHLGDCDLRLPVANANNERAHANKHYRLLAHYFYAAKQCIIKKQRSGGGGGGGEQSDNNNSKNNTLVHLCLCGTQAETWRLLDAAAANGFSLVKQQSAQEPFDKLFDKKLTAAKPAAWHGASRRSRNGRSASRDWLGKYGYEHRRTHGDGADANAKRLDLSGATHYVFTAARRPGRDAATSDQSVATKVDNQGTLPIDDSSTSSDCNICGMACAGPLELQAHLKAPALPDEPSRLQATHDDNACSTINETRQMSINTPNSSNNSNSNSNNTVIHSDVVSSQQLDAKEGEATHSQTVTVSTPNNGKRLRWYIQHCMCPPKRSKKQCELLVKQGKVVVNGDLATDSGRILSTGVQVSILANESQPPSDGQLNVSGTTTVPLIRVVKSWSDVLNVVWKPVAMRTIGSFDASTLERTFAKQTNCSYKSLSKLDTGCSGLCVMQLVEPNSDASISIRHSFTALVYGHVPLDWCVSGGATVQLPLDAMRRWRKRPLATEASDETIAPKCSTATAYIQCLEQSDTDSSSSDSVPELSTVTISTDSDTSGIGSLICFFLRKAGHPVVGDRFAGNEYLSLPRSMRNRVKHRLSIGCTRVECQRLGFVAEEQVPDKWKASYWQAFVLAASGTTTETAHTS